MSVITPQETLDYEALVASSCGSAFGDWPLEDAEYTVTIDVELANRVHGDVDNIAKSVLDGLNGVLWKDDKSVRRLVIERHYGEDAGVHVCVEAHAIEKKKVTRRKKPATVGA